MNKKDKDRLMRLQKIIAAVPFSASGMATKTGYGAVLYEEDMRSLRPYIGKVLEGMVLEGTPELEVGYDYLDPDKLMDGIEAWIEQRKVEQWQYSGVMIDKFLWRDA